MGIKRDSEFFFFFFFLVVGDKLSIYSWTIVILCCITNPYIFTFHNFVLEIAPSLQKLCSLIYESLNDCII